MSTPDQPASYPPGSPAGPGTPHAQPAQPAPGHYPPPPQAPRPYAPHAWTGQPPTPAASGSRRGVAMTAVILGALPLVGDLLQPFVLTSLVAAGGYAVYSVFALAIGIVSLLLGIGALVCGLIARRDAPLLSGVGIGLGAAVVVGALASFLYGVAALF